VDGEHLRARHGVEQRHLVEGPAHDGDLGAVRHGGHRRQDSRHRVHVAVAVDVSRRDPHRDERRELRLALATHLCRIDLAGERSAHEDVERMETPCRRIDERRNVREWRAADEVQVQTDAEPRRVTLHALGRFAEGGRRCDQRRGADGARRVGLEDPAVHAGREPEVVGIDDENAHGG
jgi:hypothetical protein